MKVLIVDDNPTQRLIVSKQLQHLGHLCVTASDGEQAVEMYLHEAPGLVLMDVQMPGMGGIAATRAIRELDGEKAWTPVIFLTGLAGDEDLSAGIEAGGDDYLTKPAPTMVLAAKIKAMTRLYEMRTRLQSTTRSLQEANRELLRLTTIDGLTGIANRRRFDEALRVEWLRAVRDTTALSLLMIDIDYFKPYNDHYGHVAGDECLRKVAQALRDHVHRPADVVARYGGEEFAVLLPLTPLGGALRVSDGLCKTIAGLSLPHARSAAANCVTVSVGACTMVPERGLDVEQIIAMADAQLYVAKKEGRNRAVGREVLGYARNRPG